MLLLPNQKKARDEHTYNQITEDQTLNKTTKQTRNRLIIKMSNS